MVILQAYEQTGNRNTPKLQGQFPQKDSGFTKAALLINFILFCKKDIYRDQAVRGLI